MHIRSIVMCTGINIMAISIHLCNLSAQSVLLAVVVAPAINYTWLIVYNTTATHTHTHIHTHMTYIFSLTFTACYHVQDTCKWKCPKQCTPTDQIQPIRPNTALMLAVWQILFVNLGVFIKKLMVSKYITCSYNQTQQLKLRCFACSRG